MFVLEGRKEDAIDILYKQLPKPEGQSIMKFNSLSKKRLFRNFSLDVEILYDSSIHFHERLYVKLGVDITHIKLSRTLHDIISQPLIFVREILAKETFDALDKLHKVC